MNARKTKKSQLTKQQRKLVRGRPLGTKKRRDFEQTRVGFILKYETTVEYDIVMGAVEETGLIPPHDLIISVSKSSSDPVFKTKRFLSALEDYRVNGVYTRPKPPPSESNLKRYAEIRKNKLREYIWNNRFYMSLLVNN